MSRPTQWGTDSQTSPFILAGGKGTRLAPLTTVIPKPLMPLGEEPIIDVLLRQLSQQGWDSATLAVGHMADLMRAYCGSGERYGLALDYLQESRPLGTVGPLAQIPEERRGDRLLVMNGDLLTTLKFVDLAEAHEESGAIATIAVQKRSIEMEFGVLDLDQNLGSTHRVANYREKPSLEATVSMGVYVFEPGVLAYITPGERLDLPELISRLLDDGQLVAGYPFDGYWLDIGRHSDYQRAVDEFALVKSQILNGAAPPSVARTPVAVGGGSA